MNATALVTGAGSGIGRAIATRLLREGLCVAAMDRDRTALDAARRDEWCDAADRLLAIVADVTQPNEVESALASAERSLGPLGILVNNAGITGGPLAMRLHETSLEDFDRVCDVNVRGVFLLCRAALSGMLARQGGVIVNVASVAGLVAFPARAAYSVSKGAVIQLTRSIAIDYAGSGIRCNAVCPGMIDTPMTHWRLEQPALAAQITARIPQGVIGNVDDIAAAVWFLAGRDARYLNGATLVVDGGYSSQ